MAASCITWRCCQPLMAIMASFCKRLLVQAAGIASSYIVSNVRCASMAAIATHSMHPFNWAFQPHTSSAGFFFDGTAVRQTGTASHWFDLIFLDG